MTLLPSTMRGSPNLSSDVLVFLLLSVVAAAPQPGLRERAQRSAPGSTP